MKKIAGQILFLVGMTIGFGFLTVFHAGMAEAEPNYTQIMILNLLTMIYLHQVFVVAKK